MFSKDEHDYGYTTTVSHDIPTRDAYQSNRDIIKSKRHVQDLVSQGIIKESCSLWSSPAMIVIKKNGSVRFCCDSRRLNQMTHEDAYPLPQVKESLDALGKAQLFLTLDLIAGYFHVPM